MTCMVCNDRTSNAFPTIKSNDIRRDYNLHTPQDARRMLRRGRLGYMSDNGIKSLIGKVCGSCMAQAVTNYNSIAELESS